MAFSGHEEIAKLVDSAILKKDNSLKAVQVWKRRGQGYCRHRLLDCTQLLQHRTILYLVDFDLNTLHVDIVDSEVTPNRGHIHCAVLVLDMNEVASLVSSLNVIGEEGISDWIVEGRVI